MAEKTISKFSESLQKKSVGEVTPTTTPRPRVEYPGSQHVSEQRPNRSQRPSEED